MRKYQDDDTGFGGTAKIMSTNGHNLKCYGIQLQWYVNSFGCCLFSLQKSCSSSSVHEEIPRIAAGSLVEVYWKKDLLACGFYDPHSPLRVHQLLGCSGRDRVSLDDELVVSLAVFFFNIKFIAGAISVPHKRLHRLHRLTPVTPVNTGYTGYTGLHRLHQLHRFAPVTPVNTG